MPRKITKEDLKWKEECGYKVGPEKCIVCGKRMVNRQRYLGYTICSEQCRSVFNEKQYKLGPTLVGQLGEYEICCDLLKRGFFVFKSFTFQNPIDLIVYLKDKEFIYRVEVKTAKRTKNIFSTKVYASQPKNDHWDILAQNYVYEQHIQYFYNPKLTEEMKKAFHDQINGITEIKTIINEETPSLN